MSKCKASLDGERITAIQVRVKPLPPAVPLSGTQDPKVPSGSEQTSGVTAPKSRDVQ